ncbi:MAG TPA: bifunctional YncE family protein/alkaline phosphatase family protein [Bryobacteraceae bacterium]|nr:bifunctional YncE family protein/alkaline phosphatase family protein [Bryobacteraceae bacterium]
MNLKRLVLLIAVITLAAVLCSSQSAPREQVGLLQNGGYLLNSGWRVKPAGTQVPLDTLPMSAALSKNGKFLLVLNGGYKPPSISVLDTQDGHELSRTPVSDGWLGLALSPNGRTLWVGGGSRASIFEFSLDDNGTLKPGNTFELVKGATRTHSDFIGDVAVSPDGRLLYACDLFHDSILVVNPQSGMIVDRFKTGRRPYRILFAPDGKSFFVTSWADGTMVHHQTSDGSQLQTLRLGAHPTDMVWRDRSGSSEEEAPARIFVSAANTNNVYAVAVSGSGESHLLETINISTSPLHPLGMTPSALALSADQSKLYVVCSDANAAAVVDVTESRSHVLGFIPTGWYPTAARALADGRLVVLNGRGSRSYPNPNGPNPTLRPSVVHGGSPLEYVGRIQTGSASFVPAFDEQQLQSYTAEVLSNSPYNDGLLDSQPAGIPPIEHVLYIVKENRTYDQILGDIGKGESDPSLCLFKENVSPNHHKLAREFVLFDNFYVSGDVSGDGHNWSTSAIANDYVVKMWPNSYAGRRKHYDYEGGEPAALPPAGYLWTNASARGISMRNYGYWATNRKEPAADGTQIEGVRDPILAKVTNLKYRSFDLDYPDVKRAQTFLTDLAEFETSGSMPAMMFMRLGNDHTSGTAAGKIAPLSSFADNDYALGMIVEGLSKSKFWKSTAIFVLEDDAQNGPDHIDSHRSAAFVISPYTHTGAVNSTMYNTTSMLRTMELILHLRPMTHFDAGARPMLNCFSKDPMLTAYQAEKPRISLEDRNPSNSATAARSARLDFSQEDLNDDDEMNDILWLAIKHTDPPPPVRSIFPESQP